ncbi:MAG: winged helix-turn-helix transcriptional regulator [Burkholderiales bacterium]|nr:winged helix-turn-helix transcriptional regulator [Burkholderiales bacterium]
MTLSLRDPHTLDELLNYRLARLYAASVAPVTRLMEGRWGISRREWRLLALLAAFGATSPSALAQRAHLDRPRTSRAIGSLVAKQLAERSAELGDARRARIVLTEAGRQLYREVFPQVAAINARVMTVLDDTAAQALDRALEQLTAHAVQLNAELARDVGADRQAGGSRRVRARHRQAQPG